MRFKKIYIEITNACNFSCSFCFKSQRKKKFVSPEEFSAILFAIKDYTKYIYLHVLGEPLIHPQFGSLLKTAAENDFFVNITTNGSLIKEKQSELEENNIRQYNISLHDAQENINENEIDEYLNNIFLFSKKNAEKSYFSFRLWNQGAENISNFNDYCIKKINDFFNSSINPEELKTQRNIKIASHIFLQNSARFSWPGEKELNISHRYCYALKDHIAILCDGTVVPCCLDAGATMPLGNIFNESMEKILKKERTKNLIGDFRNKNVREETCKNCGFIINK